MEPVALTCDAAGCTDLWCSRLYWPVMQPVVLTCDGAEQQILLDVPVYVVKTLRLQRWPGRQDRVQRAQSVRLSYKQQLSRDATS